MPPMFSDDEQTPQAGGHDGIRAVAPSEQRSAIVTDGLRQASISLEGRELATALTLTDAMVRFAPDEARVWGLRARCLRAHGDLDGADEAESTAVRLLAQQLERVRPSLSLRHRMARFSEVTFLGGPPSAFVEMGQMQLMVMLEHGLETHHQVVDIGCGALRAGLWLVRLLDEGGYCGLEPHRARLRFGVEHVLGAQLVRRKRPCFDHNTRFDLSVFERRFDFFVARSVWTHAAKSQILMMLDGFVEHGAPGAVMLSSFLPARDGRPDYLGDGWVGRSEASPFGGLVCHDPAWIQRACADRDLAVVALDEHVANQQIWLKIVRRGDEVQPR
jgi:hypothetical protein